MPQSIISVSRIHFIHYKTNQWVYPILQVLPTDYRLLFLCVCCLSIIILYIIGERVAKLLVYRSRSADLYAKPYFV